MTKKELKRSRKNIERMVELFNRGKKWIKGSYERDGSYCLLGAARACEGTLAFINALKFAGYPKGCNENIVEFNDSPHTTWKQVRSYLTKLTKKIDKELSK